MTFQSTNLLGGWQRVKLEEVCEKITDGTHQSPSFTFEGIPFLFVRNIVSGKIDFNVEKYVSQETYEELTRRHRALPGDILFSAVGSFGVAVVVNTFRPFTFQRHIALIKPKKNKIHPYFLALYLNSPNGRLQSEIAATGGSQRTVTLQALADFEIPLPPLEEQRQIATILEKCDRLRRTRRYALQLSDTFLQSVFLEMFGNFLQLNTENQFQEVLEIPLSNGVFEKNENYGCGTPVIWVDNLYHTTSIDTSKLRRANLDNKSIQKYEVFEGDLLFTRSSLVREGTGQINIVPKLSERTTFECHTIRARVNKKLVNPYYILGLYRSSYGRNLIMQRANTATMTTIGQEGIEELLCPIPPLPLQEKFAQIVQKFERLRTQQRESDRQAEHLFQTLLHRAFRGELTSSDFNDEPVSVFSQEIPVQQPKPKYPSEIAEYLRTKVNQQETEAVQLTLPGLE